ncbi:MAG: hypothetical protein AB4426_25955 [Xenococcaceae cyanobacterium]
MPRKKIDKNTKYIVFRIGYCVGNNIDKARAIAYKLKLFPSEIWKKYGSLKDWGVNSDSLDQELKQTNPSNKYEVDFKHWQQTFMLTTLRRCLKSLYVRSGASKMVGYGAWNLPVTCSQLQRSRA